MCLISATKRRAVAVGVDIDRELALSCSKLGAALRVFAIILLIQGCTSKALSIEECQMIIDAETSYLDSLLAPSSDVSSWKKDRNKKALAMCLSGDLYSRNDLKCFERAQSDLDLNNCMTQIHEKAGK